MAPEAEAAEILSALGRQSCSRLCLSGGFRNVRAGIGIDLSSFEISLTLPEDGPEMEKMGKIDFDGTRGSVPFSAAYSY